MTRQIKEPLPLKPVPKMRRNDPCWCGSGQKWKTCHRGREEAPRVANPNQPIAGLMKAFRSGSHCYHPNAPDGCKGRVISSHTIQRNGPLARIARNGHVYGYRVPNVVDDESLPKLIGLKDASTFPGFCTNHDCQLFAPVERSGFDATHANAFLLAYRALTYELHQKRKSLGAAAIVSSLDGGRPFADQAFVQQLAANFYSDAVVAEAELHKHWLEMKADYVEGQFASLQSVFLFFDRPLPFVSSFYIPPYEDFDDGCVQGWRDLELDYVALSSLNWGNGSAVALSWRRGSKLSRLADQLEASDRRHTATLLFRFALANSENVFLSPEWYESLSAQNLGELNLLFGHNSPGAPRASIPGDGSRPLIDAALKNTIRLS